MPDLPLNLSLVTRRRAVESLALMVKYSAIAQMLVKRHVVHSPAMENVLSQKSVKLDAFVRMAQ